MRLQHISKHLEDPDIDNSVKQSALVQVFQGFLHCGTRRFQETSLALSLLKPSEISAVETHEQKLSGLLYHLRVRAFNAALPKKDVHTYNAYMQVLGETYGVAAPGSSYPDPLSHGVGDVDKFRQRFDSTYAPKQIVDYVFKASPDKTQINPAVIPGLLADLAPKFSVSSKHTSP